MSSSIPPSRFIREQPVEPLGELGLGQGRGAAGDAPRLASNRWRSRLPISSADWHASASRTKLRSVGPRSRAAEIGHSLRVIWHAVFPSVSERLDHGQRHPDVLTEP